MCDQRYDGKLSAFIHPKSGGSVRRSYAKNVPTCAEEPVPSLSTCKAYSRRSSSVCVSSPSSFFFVFPVIMAVTAFFLKNVAAIGHHITPLYIFLRSLIGERIISDFRFPSISRFHWRKLMNLESGCCSLSARGVDRKQLTEALAEAFISLLDCCCPL